MFAQHVENERTCWTLFEAVPYKQYIDQKYKTKPNVLIAGSFDTKPTIKNGVLFCFLFLNLIRDRVKFSNFNQLWLNHNKHDESVIMKNGICQIFIKLDHKEQSSSVQLPGSTSFDESGGSSPL